jgi:hypothetical protein
MIKNCRLSENSGKIPKVTRKIDISLKFFRSAPEKFKFTSTSRNFCSGLDRLGPVLEYFVKNACARGFLKMYSSTHKMSPLAV